MTHLVRYLLEEVGLEAIKAKMTRDLSEFTFAPHYGCHYLKPSETIGGLDDPEAPTSMGALIEATGAKVDNYPGSRTAAGAGCWGPTRSWPGRWPGPSWPSSTPAR